MIKTDWWLNYLEVSWLTGTRWLDGSLKACAMATAISYLVICSFPEKWKIPLMDGSCREKDLFHHRSHPSGCDPWFNLSGSDRWSNPGLSNSFSLRTTSVIVALKGLVISNFNVSCLTATKLNLLCSLSQSGIPLLLNILETYGRLSGHTLNIQYPQILTLFFNPLKLLMGNYQFNWHQSQFEYLATLLKKTCTNLLAWD